MASTRVRASDERTVETTLGVFCELRADPFESRLYLANACSRLVRDHFVSLVESRPAGPDGKPIIEFHCTGGALPNRDDGRILEFMQDPVQINPAIPKMFELGGVLRTRPRARLVEDADWHPSRFHQHFLRHLGLNDEILSHARLSNGVLSSICMSTYAKESCSPRAVRVLRLLHRRLVELPRFVAPSPMDEHASSRTVRALYPDQRRVLAGILDGESVKVTATRMDIPRKRVEQFRRELCLRFRVKDGHDGLLRLFRGYDAALANACREDAAGTWQLACPDPSPRPRRKRGRPRNSGMRANWTA